MCFTKPRDKPDSFDSGILVRENTRTVKVDNTDAYNAGKSKKTINKANSDGQLKNHRRKRSCYRTGSTETTSNSNETDTGVVCSLNGNNKSSSCFLNSANNSSSHKTSVADGHIKHGTLVPATTNWIGSTEHVHSRAYERVSGRSDSIVSACSTASECQSTFSTSDITLNMQAGLSRENSFKRPKSAPGTFVRNASSGSLPNMVINNFIASSPDNFRSHGAWRFIAEYKGKWESMCVLKDHI